MEAEHDRLFDEIAGKLQELSKQSDSQPVDRFEKMQIQLRRSQEELKQAQDEIQDRIRSMDSMKFSSDDFTREIRRVSEQLEQERMNNSKLSTDLAKSLELNLKLQFEIEEIRSKASQALNEEKKHNHFLQDKLKSVGHELDLSQALCNETRLELAKAKEKFHQEAHSWAVEKRELSNKWADSTQEIENRDALITQLKEDLNQKMDEISQLSENLLAFEEQAYKQNEMMKELTTVAEKKMIELKMALDKKTIESQDYYSHLQQAMTQVNVLRQENAALRDYIGKLSALHQAKMNQ
jgi:chromosome segregation ATPase